MGKGTEKLYKAKIDAAAKNDPATRTFVKRFVIHTTEGAGFTMSGLHSDQTWTHFLIGRSDPKNKRGNVYILQTLPLNAEGNGMSNYLCPGWTKGVAPCVPKPDPANPKKTIPCPKDALKCPKGCVASIGGRNNFGCRWGESYNYGAIQIDVAGRVADGIMEDAEVLKAISAVFMRVTEYYPTIPRTVDAANCISFERESCRSVWRPAGPRVNPNRPPHEFMQYSGLMGHRHIEPNDRMDPGVFDVSRVIPGYKRPAIPPHLNPLNLKCLLTGSAYKEAVQAFNRQCKDQVEYDRRNAPSQHLRERVPM